MNHTTHSTQPYTTLHNGFAVCVFKHLCVSNTSLGFNPLVFDVDFVIKIHFPRLIARTLELWSSDHSDLDTCFSQNFSDFDTLFALPLKSIPLLPLFRVFFFFWGGGGGRSADVVQLSMEVIPGYMEVPENCEILCSVTTSLQDSLIPCQNRGVGPHTLLEMLGKSFPTFYFMHLPNIVSKDKCLHNGQPVLGK